jgi:hypothetical protein
LSEVLAVLRDPATIRLRSAAITQAVADGRSSRFLLDRSRLDTAAERVATLTRRRFPDLRIPFHSRWRHFEAGGVDRKARLDALLADRGPAGRARAMFDLVVVSVLLDAGAGASWRYRDADGREYARSEGLGVATLQAFLDGRFAAGPDERLMVDAHALQHLQAGALREVFQVGADNPLVGIDGRLGLMQRLGVALQAEARRGGGEARPAILFDRITADGTRSSVAAADVLREVLRVLGPVWTSGSTVAGVLAGDVWPHRFAGAAGPGGRDVVTAGWVPFHKLSQWLTYSLLEPLQWAGIEVTGLDALTGLPEYRNGGLLLDTGVLLPRNSRDLEGRLKPGDEFVVEWRALTVTLLDELADRVRALLGRGAAEMPLACVLEGGTWAAGREIAAERRPGALPPVTIDSDGTVF